MKNQKGAYFKFRITFIMRSYKEAFETGITEETLVSLSVDENLLTQ